MRRWLLISVPYLWLFFFFLVPFFIVFKISLSDTEIAIPPYTPLLDLSEGWAGIKDFFSQLDFENYRIIFSDALYVNAYGSSLRIAFISTLITLAVGFPIAYGMARAPKAWQPMLLMLVILPFWTSFLIRVYAWIGILKQEGLLNHFLMNLGLISAPLHILHTDTAVYIGIVYSYLPFMILPLYASLEKINPALLEAAADLGSPPWKSFWQITFPLSMPGVLAGSFLVFIPAVGEFVIPDLLGGSDTLMIGKTLWTEFFSNRDW
ncbi:MAG TPA: ABC transporter permease subunit, partial [Hyphomicrobium sp.]|nr:ABC transporter permease subunit [Hyphomicrobium sp.]